MATMPGMEKNHRLIAAREKKGYSLDDLAKKLGTAKPVIWRFEIGERPLKYEWAKRLAKALDCNPFDLMDESSDESEMLPAPDTFLENQPDNELDHAEFITQVKPLPSFEGASEEMASVDPVYQHVQQIRRTQAEFEDRFDAATEHFGEKMDGLTQAIHQLIDEIRQGRPKRARPHNKK